MRPLATLAALPILLHGLAVAAPAGPCTAPERYVKVARAGIAPLMTPYVVAGIAAVSLREQDGERWLELAAGSADEARRLLAGQGAGAAFPEVATWRDRVWLRCPAPAGRT
jgi:hypothetical protein